MARVTICVLGGFCILLEGQPATAFESDKARALLAYLAVESQRPQRREALAGLLWPERPDAVALRNLRGALFNVRQVLGDLDVPIPLLFPTRESISFNRAGDYWLDSQALGELTAGPPAAERLEQAVELYRGAFLDER